MLCWLVFRIGAWAFSIRAGMYAGLALATSVGLFLFTRIQIPDVTITATIALAMWAFLRALDDEEPRSGSLERGHGGGDRHGIAAEGLDRRCISGCCRVCCIWRSRARSLRGRAWQRLHPFRGILIALAIAAPWHMLATLRNPPYFDFTMHSAPGEYRGFFWFYFINEHVLRFLNLRYPRDYNTVPRVLFWLFHLLWLFPLSVYFPAVAKLSFRAGQSCWANAPAVPVLGRISADVLHVFIDAGILFDAVLSGAGVAAGKRVDGGAGEEIRERGNDRAGCRSRRWRWLRSCTFFRRSGACPRPAIFPMR